MKHGLTAFRAVAFLAVFMGHIGGFDAGYIGVLAFFVLSGFLLTPILLDMKQNLPTKRFFINFYGRRALRIFPLYYLYLVGLSLLCYWITTRPDYIGIGEVEHFLQQLPWAVTYSYNFYHASRQFVPTPLLTHFWSLAVEEQFYLIWPVVLFLTPRHRYPTLLLGLVLAGPSVRETIALIHEAQWLPGLTPYRDLLIYVLPFSHLDAFAIGGYFALTQKQMATRWIWLLAGLLVALGFGTEWWHYHNLYYSSLGYRAFMLDSYKYLWGYSLWSLFFACMLVQLRNDAFLPFLFGNPVLQYLGKISYGLYVFHFPILWCIHFFFPAIAWPLWLFAALLATILLSVLSYELFESRWLTLKDRYFGL